MLPRLPGPGPERIPLSLLAQEQGAEMTHPIRALFPPAHPCPLQALADDRLARRLHRTRADLPTLGHVPRVVHPMPLVLEVGHRRLPHLASRRSRPAAPRAQLLEHRPAPLVLQAV